MLDREVAKTASFQERSISAFHLGGVNHYLAHHARVISDIRDGLGVDSGTAMIITLALKAVSDQLGFAKPTIANADSTVRELLASINIEAREYGVVFDI